jgi:hypothetical protein
MPPTSRGRPRGYIGGPPDNYPVVPDDPVGIALPGHSRILERFLGRHWERYAAQMPGAATLVVWFHLRSPDLGEKFESFMAGDRDLALGSLDTISDWRLTRPLDVPGQPSDPADYVLIAEITELDRWEEEASEQVELLADRLAEFVSTRRMLVVAPVL